ncbi:uncharacterized protein LOC122392187 [Amphibalanus amphitrite]|uniref:uncharacterized protein LOC122392187 n=1 Tax=Amphibalanus amphitrite TaxID=1232801 RepID=UPI001C91D06D|nr:uncharacterized protein LOC122392187 [Amphibalanus amphitrite]
MIMLGEALLLTVCALAASVGAVEMTPPDGYYLFDTAPFKTPPKVRKPPYAQTSKPCPGLDSPKEDMRLSETLCGDLQTGKLPKNPIQPEGFDGHAYPFELIKNKSLEFFGSTLPILKKDPTLPKVARFQKPSKIKHHAQSNGLFAKRGRGRRSAEGQGQGQGQPKADAGDEEPARNSRGFCDTNWGVFCTLFRGWSGGGGGGGDSDEEVSQRSSPDLTSGDAPLTPCPSVVDYVTPVFARNYEGIWRYVVQIPHEGYFTQTIEVTSCVSSRCHLLEGSCLSSPRWISLLVAELFYPHQTFPLAAPVTPPRAPVSGQQPPAPAPAPAQLQERAGRPAEHCDGTDQLGCYQVRLYYDWFLVPGSCKCWKNDVFAQYRAAKRTPKSAGH